MEGGVQHQPRQQSQGQVADAKAATELYIPQVSWQENNEQHRSHHCQAQIDQWLAPPNLHA